MLGKRASDQLALRTTQRRVDGIAVFGEISSLVTRLISYFAPHMKSAHGQ